MRLAFCHSLRSSPRASSIEARSRRSIRHRSARRRYGIEPPRIRVSLLRRIDFIDHCGGRNGELLKPNFPRGCPGQQVAMTADSTSKGLDLASMSRNEPSRYTGKHGKSCQSGHSQRVPSEGNYFGRRVDSHLGVDLACECGVRRSTYKAKNDRPTTIAVRKNRRHRQPAGQPPEGLRPTLPPCHRSELIMT